jgi:hypothetical protein
MDQKLDLTWDLIHRLSRSDLIEFPSTWFNVKPNLDRALK